MAASSRLPPQHAAAISTTASSQRPAERPENGTIRRLLIALVLFGVAGLFVDLLLLKHYETVLHAIPVVLLGAALAITVAAAARPGRRTLAVFRAAMALCVLIGVGGVVLHLRGNLAWALERDETLGGWPLLWNAVRGATPLLAPGALAQLGLLGLIFTHHHPALARGAHHEQEIR